MESTREKLAITRQTLWRLLVHEADFLWVILTYGVGISLLTLAVPVAVQYLINTIINIGSFRAVAVLAITLFIILIASGLLSALRMWVVERYERRVFARLTSDIAFRLIAAQKAFFTDPKNAGLSTRYFEILLLQKNVPYLVLDGFALVLQAAVGFTLVSFYHPWLFVFNAIVVLTVFAIWRLWATGAKNTAILRSKEKYRTAAWLSQLEGVSSSTSQQDLDSIIQESDFRIAQFIDAHRNHFRYTFPQALSFLALYAIGSAGLLGLGGWLVTRGLLSIGQLVAAELVMASIFLGLSRFSTYLKAYYELYGVADKIGEVLNIPIANTVAQPDPATLFQSPR